MSLRSRVMIEVASNNPIGPSIGMAGTSSSISRTPKRVRSTIWQHFRKLRSLKTKKKLLKLFIITTNVYFTVSTNGTSHLKRHVDKCLAKNASNVSLSQSQITYLKVGDK